MPHDSSQHNWEAGWQENDPFQQGDHFQVYDNGDECSSGFHEDHTGNKGYWNQDGEFVADTDDHLFAAGQEDAHLSTPDFYHHQENYDDQFPAREANPPFNEDTSGYPNSVDPEFADPFSHFVDPNHESSLAGNLDAWGDPFGTASLHDGHSVAGVDADALLHAQAMAVFAAQNHSSSFDLETTDEIEGLPESEEQQSFPILAALTEQTDSSGSEAETTTQSELPPPQGTNHGTTQDAGEEQVPQKPRKAFNVEISNQEPKIPPDAKGEVYADRSDANHADGKAIPGQDPAAIENASESDASTHLPEQTQLEGQVTLSTSITAEHQPKKKNPESPKVEKPVDAMNDGDKLKAVLQKTLEKLPDKAREILQQLVAPENIVTTGGVIAATALAQGTPLAPFVDAALTAFAIEQLGDQAKEAIDELNAFLQSWNNMQSEEDLESAAEHLANLVEMGAGILLDKLMDGRGHGEGEGRFGNNRPKDLDGKSGSNRTPEHPVLDESKATPESLPLSEANPLDLKSKETSGHPNSEEGKQPTSKTSHPEEGNASDSPLVDEQLLFEKKQKWREEGETAWQVLEQQISDGQKYTGEFKSKEEFLKRYEDGQTFNPETRSWGKQAELRADSREPIMYSTESKPQEVLEGLIGSTEQGNDKSFAPYLKMLKSLGLEDQGNKNVLAKLEELGFGKNPEGGQGKKSKELKEDDVRSALKKHFEARVLNRITDPDAHSCEKLADQIRESEPNLSKREAMERASEQVKKQSEAEVEALLKKDPKLTRKQAEVLRQQQESHQVASEITENLSSSDKGNLMEDWYDRVYGTERAIRHYPIGEVDEFHPTPKSKKQRGRLGSIELEGVRAIDRLEVREVGGQQIAQLKEIKAISSELSGENLSQFRDFAKIASERPEVDLTKKSGEGGKSGKARITGLTYTITNPGGVVENASFILDAVSRDGNLSFEIFNKIGEKMMIDLNNFDDWTVKDLIKWANSTN